MVMRYARPSLYRQVLLRISYSKCFISGQRPARSYFFVPALRDYVRKAEQEEGRLATDTVETHFAYERSELKVGMIARNALVIVKGFAILAPKNN